MKQIYVRPALADDTKTFLEWEAQQQEFDPAVVGYPDTFTLCAYDDSGPVAFLPVQQAPVADSFILESVAFKPGASDLTQAVALRELYKTCVFLGHAKNTGEIYFVGTNPATNLFAERHGFEKIDYPVYRVRLADLK